MDNIEFFNLLNESAMKGAKALTSALFINKVLTPEECLKVIDNIPATLEFIDKEINDPDLSLHELKQCLATLFVIKIHLNSQIEVFEERIKRAEDAGEIDDPGAPPKKRECQTCKKLDICKERTAKVINILKEDMQDAEKYPTAAAAIEAAEAWLQAPTHDGYDKVRELLKPIRDAYLQDQEKDVKELLELLKNVNKINGEKEEEEEEAWEEDCTKCPKYPVCLTVAQHAIDLLRMARDEYQAPSAQAAIDLMEDWKRDPNEEKHKAAGKLLEKVYDELPDEAAEEMTAKGSAAEEAALIDFIKKGMGKK